MQPNLVLLDDPPHIPAAGTSTARGDVGPASVLGQPEVGMATIPQPRLPRCYVHHVWHASCVACREQHAAEQAAAKQRLDRAAR